MPRAPQTFANHVRIVPGFHYGVLGIFVLNLLWSLYRLWRTPGGDAAVQALVAAALLGLFFYARMFALTVQNRVIRLEMRLRLGELLPEDVRGRVGELRTGQLIALRFASDQELPELVRETLAERLPAPAIKRKIRDWQADHLRA